MNYSKYWIGILFRYPSSDDTLLSFFLLHFYLPNCGSRMFHFDDEDTSSAFEYCKLMSRWPNQRYLSWRAAGLLWQVFVEFCYVLEVVCFVDHTRDVNNNDFTGEIGMFFVVVECVMCKYVCVACVYLWCHLHKHQQHPHV